MSGVRVARCSARAALPGRAPPRKGLGFRVQGLGFSSLGNQGLGLRLQGFGVWIGAGGFRLRISDCEFWIWGFGVKGLGFRIRSFERRVEKDFWGDLGGERPYICHHQCKATRLAHKKMCPRVDTKYLFSTDTQVTMQFW